MQCAILKGEKVVSKGSVNLVSEQGQFKIRLDNIGRVAKEGIQKRDERSGYSFTHVENRDAPRECVSFEENDIDMLTSKSCSSVGTARTAADDKYLSANRLLNYEERA